MCDDRCCPQPVVVNVQRLLPSRSSPQPPSARGYQQNDDLACLFERAEDIYNFQGVRRYKDKYDPLWGPRYIAAARKWAIPILLVTGYSSSTKEIGTQFPILRKPYQLHELSRELEKLML